MIRSIGYWNDFLVPALVKCQIDLCFAVSCNYFYVLGFFLFVHLTCIKFDLF